MNPDFRTAPRMPHTRLVPIEPPLVGREREVGLLRSAIEGAAAGSGALVVVEGVSGIGKTRLLRTARAVARDAGYAVLAAHGSEMELQLAFGVVRQLLEPAVRRDPELLAGTAMAARHVFDPALDTGDTGEVATLHGLHWLTVEAARLPTVLLVDDAHWADAASLRYLAYLLPRLAELPIAVILSIRTGEPRPAETLLRDLVTDPDTTVIQPGPLRTSAVADLLAALLDVAAEAEFAAACEQVTAGNPLLLRALAQGIADAGVPPTRDSVAHVTRLAPGAVSRLTAQRLARLSASTRAVAEAVAVLGGSSPVATVSALLGQDELSTWDSVEELAGLGLVESADGGVSYTHPIVATAVYGGLSRRARAQAHAKASTVLDVPGADPDRVAAHVLKTPPGLDPRAVPRLVRAADAAARRGSPEAAFTFLDRCLREELPAGDRYALLVRTADLAVQVDLAAAIRVLQQAQAIAPPSDRAMIGARLGVAYGFLQHPDRAVDALSEALRTVPAADLDGRRRILATLLVGAVLVPGQRAQAESDGWAGAETRQLATVDSLGGRMLAAALSIHEMAAADPAGAARARQALADGVLVREANGEGPLVCGWITLLAADDPAGLSSVDDAMRHAQRHGSWRALAPAYTFRALGLLWTGQLGDAESDARQALRMARSDRVDMAPAFAAAYLADSLIAQGRLAEAEAVLSSVSVPLERTATRPRYYALDSYARLRRHQGRPGEAAAAALDAGRCWAEFGFINPAMGSWRTEAALALFALGDPVAARRWADEELELARRWGAPRALGRALRVSGQLAGGGEGLELLGESVAVLASSPARLEYATSLTELGAARRRAGRRQDAREALDRALEEAQLCAAAAVAEQARTELRTAGFRPRRARPFGPASLTPSERRVVEQAVTGATNREIAQALFITVKTVEVHLTSAYRKLGVSRRRDLQPALHE